MRKRSSLLIIIVSLFVTVGALAAWSLRSPLSRLAGLAWTRVKPSPTVTFAVVGDNHGDNPIYRQILEALPADHPSFLLNLADTSEFGSRAEFEDIRNLEKALPFPVYHTVGNHDIKTDDTRKLFTDVFHQPPYQSIDQGELHLVILDNADRHVGFPAESIDWLQRDLAAHQHQTIIVAYHRPFDLPLQKIVGDDETRASRNSNDKVVALFKKYHVSYILTAHLHTYFQYDVEDIPAVVSGGGGDPAQDILGGPSNDFFHYLIVNVKNGQVDINLHRVQLTH